jgi:hypothetical protein
MNCPQPIASLLCALLATTATVPVCRGQQQVVAPAGYGYASGSGEGRIGTAFAAGYQRELTLFDRQHLGFGAAVIEEIAWRHAATAGQPSPGHTAQVVIRIAQTFEEPERMGYRFSAVLGPSPVEVFRGPVQLPPVNTNGSVRPFDVVVPLATPFAFDPARGNLAVDVEVQSPFVAGWPRDARDVRTRSVGSFRTIAAPCLNSAGFPMTQRVTAVDNCVPGGVVQTFVAGTIYTAPSVVTWVGIASPSPLDLTAIGAPGCTFAVEPWAVLPAVPVFPATTSFGYAWAEHSIPNLPQLAGASFASQWFELDAPPGNSLGVVLSDAIEITLGAAGASDYATKSLVTSLQGSDTGQQPPGDRGAITRFGLR